MSIDAKVLSVPLVSSSPRYSSWNSSAVAIGSDKEVENELFDGSNKHDQATQKLCPKRAKENEGQPLCHNAEFQKPAFQ